MTSNTSAADAGQPSPWDWQPTGPGRLQQPVSLLQLQGPDTLRFLHGQTSQDLQLARPGQWLATCCISPTARLRALAEVLVVDDGAWLVIREGAAAAIRQALDRVLFPADQVRLGTLLEGLWIEPLTSPELAAGSPLSRPWLSLESGPGWRLGSSVVLPAGAPLPADLAYLRPLAAQEMERWRLSQGQPAAPGEINEDCNPFELGLAPRVSLSKGCYVGQETLAKLATYDGVKQQLRRWYVAPPAASLVSAEATAALLAPGSMLRGPEAERAGSITSSLELPNGQGWIGLALIRRACLAAPTLWAGEGAEALALQLSTPPNFVAPPVGAGGG